MPTSKIVYLGDLRTQATHLQSNETIITDAPVDNNGKGEAFSPTDLAATSLGSCAMTIMGIVAKREGVDFSGSEIEVTKIMSAEAPRRIAKVIVDFTMKTPEALSEEVQAKYVRAAHTCPVSLSLHPDIEQVFNFNWTVA
ncbi:stress-induced protein OsmC [Emticicia aquatilis]|uniref:Stress-induced protein OsmC n=1 Tax=Emticicia aquatilis TaxID=1537369 RepID=A0A916YLP0_9BACT|nr:OsmC family protein [Emticicia aquatilis]GGD48698.1 stress-induced protein OsmC [Emticicia aquatilis]